MRNNSKQWYKKSVDKLKLHHNLLKFYFLYSEPKVFRILQVVYSKQLQIYL